jgi:Domain of unknown function (DUF4173)
MPEIDVSFMPSRMATRWLCMRLGLGVAMAAIADWLFYDRVIGLSLALFVAALGLAAIAANPVRASRRARLIAFALFGAALLALIEDISILSVALGVVATLLFALAVVSGGDAPWTLYFLRAIRLPFAGPFWLVGDVLRICRLVRRKRSAPKFFGAMAIAWIVPLGLLVVFLSLFAAANPVIENGLAMLRPIHLGEAVDALRVLFWIAILVATWPLIHLRRARQRGIIRPAGLAQAQTALEFGALFGKAAILRSLILFNALFALQTGLDIAYLWGGLALPDGLTYAAYAHRGAYPLIVTALLAAVFVLIAMRRDGPAGKSRWIRPLVLAWTAQNLALVCSSILRTKLYVATYSLTYLRLAALIWMALVAVGLVLILAQIVFNKSNSWLLAANAQALALTLYACCFINAPYIIARYNVTHCAEFNGTGPSIDLYYLQSLGPQAFPAIDDRLFQRVGSVGYKFYFRRSAQDAIEAADDWRSWTFRTWRLRQYLVSNPEAPPNAAPESQP